MTDKNDEFAQARLLLEQSSTSLLARIEKCRAETESIERDAAAYENARSALFRRWLTDNGYHWCLKCHAIIMPWMSVNVLCETYSLTDEHYPADLVDKALAHLCKGCFQRLQSGLQPWPTWNGQTVEQDYYEVRTDDEGKAEYLDDRHFAEPQWQPLPADLVDRTAPVRVPEVCARIARLPGEITEAFAARSTAP